jgi:hypothetical protein
MKIATDPRRCCLDATSAKLAEAGTPKSGWRCLWIILGLLAFPVSELRAVDFSTTNRDSLTRFWSALESSNRPVTVVSFGDSMADSYRSVTKHLMDRLIVNHGSAGYSLNNYKNTTLWNGSGGAFGRAADYFWFSHYSQIPSGGAVWWENQLNPGGSLCDQAGIYFISQTNGGQFRLLISTNGMPWTPLFTLNGYSQHPQGHVTNVALPLNRYRLRVEGDTGTNFIIGPSTIIRSTSGIHAVFVDWQGINLGQVTNVPATIREPLFAALQPDLIVWHMKEEEHILFAHSNRMAACEAWWSNTAPNCDVIYVGTPWNSTDTTGTWTMDQNAITRDVAVRFNRTFVDLMTPTVDYNWLATNGFMADWIHLNSAGGLYCANLLWNDLGFYALGVDRRITLQSVGPQLELSYQTTTNAIYHLEFSTNLVQWSGVFTNPIGGGPFSTNFTPAAGAVFYRVGLAPR